MGKNELIAILNAELDAQFLAEDPEQSLQEKLEAFIDHLIEKDFQKLVLILYKVDVSENKLRRLLQNNENEKASEIIAKLIIERELQKVESRKHFKKSPDTTDPERW